MLDMLRIKLYIDCVLWLFTFYLNFKFINAHGYHSDNTDYLLCRGCGADVADSSYIQNRFSPEALIEGNYSLFGKGSVSIQLLENPLGIRFRLIVLEKASCVGVDEWHDEFSWYPGYAWKHCVCLHCNRHLGWVFEPLGTATPNQKKPSNKGFYGLIFDNIHSESFSDSLMIVPKAFKS